MTTLVLVEHDNTKLADATLPVVTAAAKLGEVHLLVAGHNCGAVAEAAAKIAGVAKVHVAMMRPMPTALPKTSRLWRPR